MHGTSWLVRVTARALSAAWLATNVPAIVSTAPAGGTDTITPPVVVIAGDSVPYRLEDRLGAVLRSRLGWQLVSATVPACSIYGEGMAWPNGEMKGDPERCPGLVAPTQAAMVAQHDPAVVIWWDRLSTMPFFTSEGELVMAPSERFFELRSIAFAETVARLRGGGATIVFVATEPIGVGYAQRCARGTTRSCVWRRFRDRHYDDVSQPLNKMMRRYAFEHPDEAVFITITDTVCRWNTSPCNDTMWTGDLARPDGTHYEDRGERLAARSIVHDLRVALGV